MSNATIESVNESGSEMHNYLINVWGGTGYFTTPFYVSGASEVDALEILGDYLFINWRGLCFDSSEMSDYSDTEDPFFINEHGVGILYDNLKIEEIATY